MYHEEKIINGVLHWRDTPDAAFAPYTAAELTARVTMLNNQVRHLENTINAHEDKWVDENV